jgi:valyl-tRNA synthetase
MNLDPRRLEGARNFANKIWNATRFVVSTLEGAIRDGPFTGLTLPDRWIVSRFNRLVADVTDLFDTYQYGEAGRRINEFLWSEFCDWYIEACKIRLYGEDLAARTTAQTTLVSVLEGALRLLHPYMPFVTEEIWQHLKAAWPAGEIWGEALMISPWPEADDAQLDAGAEGDMALLMDLIRQIRNARAEFNVTPGKRVPAIVAGGAKLEMLKAQRELLALLAKVDDAQLTLMKALDEKPQKAVALVAAEGVEVYLPLAGLVDLEQETARLHKALAEADREIQRAEGMRSNEGFTSKAPPHVVQKQRDRLAEQQERRARLEARLQALQD